MVGEITTRLADERDLGPLTAFFDSYRQFYGQPSDEAAVARFLSERLANGDSVLILAEISGEAAGFVQLYPSFTSIGMCRIFALNDLFVAAHRRGSHVGKALVEAAIEHARAVGAMQLTLSTHSGNKVAQALYEKGGWVRDDQFYVYNYRLKA